MPTSPNETTSNHSDESEKNDRQRNAERRAKRRPLPAVQIVAVRTGLVVSGSTLAVVKPTFGVLAVTFPTVLTITSFFSALSADFEIT